MLLLLQRETKKILFLTFTHFYRLFEKVFFWKGLHAKISFIYREERPTKAKHIMKILEMKQDSFQNHYFNVQGAEVSQMLATLYFSQ